MDSTPLIQFYYFIPTTISKTIKKIKRHGSIFGYGGNAKTPQVSQISQLP
jgi:hypothetical protein